MTTERGERELAVLVTGVGAPPGVSIFKALRASPLAPRIVATDADPLSVGLFRADAAYVVPRITDDPVRYRERLEAICARERVALVCFGSEIEMRRLAPVKDEVERRTGAILVLNAGWAIDAFMDKWTMARVLAEKGLPVPDTALAAEPDAVEALLARHGFPLVLKPRRGSGSRNVFVLRSREELAFFSRYVPDAVVQEYLLPDDEEYTVGVYRSRRTGWIGQIAFRRTLAGGLTYKAEVVDDAEVAATCRRVVESFDVWGPVNVQLRKTPAGVRVFEINLRFSSSAVMRAHLGFNEPELCLRDAVLEQPLPEPRIRAGWSLRYWDEVYVSPEELAELRARGEAAGVRGTKGAGF
jgi:carbamoyl-phosphate synthase large subunit